MTRVGLINLGCPRNLVDAEVMLGLLKKEGYTITEDFADCDAAVVNTCSFIEDAKKESIDLILQLVELKKLKKIRSIIVTGCLPQRYAAELRAELSEVDSFIGTNDFVHIPEIVRRTLAGEKVTRVTTRKKFLYDHTYRRDFITPGHFAYLKLSEGCNNRCSYCVIPSVRGNLRSRSISSVLEEARLLKASGKLSELNLIGQDLTNYGVDRYKEPRLAQLLVKLAALAPARWIRLLYTHPAHYTDDLIAVVRDEPAVCKYLDIPLQHINNRILKAMNRGINKAAIIKLITRLRKEIPALTIRTTFLVGFPGETDEEFNELLQFISEMKFERLGIFSYSREEGTPAHGLKGQVPEKVKKERFDLLMRRQQEIARAVNARELGREVEVLIDEPSENKQLPGQPREFIGRTAADAPEVDGTCFVTSRKDHVSGDFIKVKITDTLEYDLVGEEIA